VRRVVSFLFISVDGVVEEPSNYVRDDVFDDLIPLIAETIASQDAVVLGRRMYEEWSTYWPASTIEPFATFINNTRKFVVSSTLGPLTWSGSTLLDGDAAEAVHALKATDGGTIGVHGSVSLVQSLLRAGVIDELRLVVFPVLAGRGRHLIDSDGPQVQLDLAWARSTPAGLQYVSLVPRHEG
jgi:dihydrofolate reductase